MSQNFIWCIKFTTGRDIYMALVMAKLKAMIMKNKICITEE